jgi:hypothetical protein
MPEATVVQTQCATIKAVGSNSPTEPTFAGPHIRTCDLERRVILRLPLIRLFAGRGRTRCSIATTSQPPNLPSEKWGDRCSRLRATCSFRAAPMIDCFARRTGKSAQGRVAIEKHRGRSRERLASGAPSGVQMTATVSSVETTLHDLFLGFVKRFRSTALDRWNADESSRSCSRGGAGRGP